MTESDKRATQEEPPGEGNDPVTVQTYGTVILVAGMALCAGALMVEDGEPSWQVLGVFMLVVLVGLVLRIEAALLRR
ncbi:hypothetical protein [Thermoactinospora rubra]|uniref:hypothetical protein n=1 Tax=Thermoactinospora rubra TaxID=1088767 RepID=UPI0011802AAF|nr:hypothetical protein [Thermoactinospora rubra]